MNEEEKKEEAIKETAEEAAKETAEETAEETAPTDEAGSEDAKDNYETEPEKEKTPSKEEEYLALAQRIQADFDNYRKRNLTARADAILDGKVETIKAFLPVMDNLERALESERKAGTTGSLMEGLELVLKQMLQALTDLGVEEIKAEGEKFDPNFHNAVMQIPAPEGQEAGVVAAVFTKGYKLKDKVLRYSMVQVTI